MTLCAGTRCRPVTGPEEGSRTRTGSASSPCRGRPCVLLPPANVHRAMLSQGPCKTHHLTVSPRPCPPRETMENAAAGFTVRRHRCGQTRGENFPHAVTGLPWLPAQPKPAQCRAPQTRLDDADSLDSSNQRTPPTTPAAPPDASNQVCGAAVLTPWAEMDAGGGGGHTKARASPAAPHSRVSSQLPSQPGSASG